MTSQVQQGKVLQGKILQGMVQKGTVTSPAGFSAGAATCGLKESGKPDLALVVADHACSAAAVFTRNQVAAAPVLVSRATLAANSNAIRAVVANAGNANACTGEPGLAAARAMQAQTAAALNCAPDQVLVLSTGVIGVQLDMKKVAAGITSAAAALSPDGGPAAAQAIMTTDTTPKTVSVQLDLPGGTVTIGGIAKGSGMIHPNMATMLGVLTTDAKMPAGQLQAALGRATDKSFNRISVDGDTSTNDTVFLLASGASGVEIDNATSLAAFEKALTEACIALAQMIVFDGEGASKFVTLTVNGAIDDQAAHLVAQTIATSPLVKTAFAGSDPNWGRILAAAGRAGVDFDQSQVALWIGTPDGESLQLVANGTPLPFAEADAGAIFRHNQVLVTLDLGQGDGQDTMWTCDLTHGYVTINADYRT